MTPHERTMSCEGVQHRGGFAAPGQCLHDGRVEAREDRGLAKKFLLFCGMGLPQKLGL